MDFARKQLEKYGWSDGKGLGKHENGISEALKPKLKRSVTGIGHDPASEFNEHWWTALYDKAAGNIEVEEKNNKTKKIKATKDFEITNCTWKLKNGNNISNEKYTDNFVRTAVLTNGGSKIENVKEAIHVESETEKKDVFQMTDEELFKACEGRTAHKGARHGLKALGKLARIAQQEELLLAQPQYNGYFQTTKKSNEEVVENISLDDENGIKIKKKKKKRRHNTNDADKNSMYNVASVEKEVDDGRKLKKTKESVAITEVDDSVNKKVKNHNNRQAVEKNIESERTDKPKKNKRKRVDRPQVVDESQREEEENIHVRKKKKRCK